MIDADTGMPVPGVATICHVISGEAVVTDALDYTLMTDGGGYAAARLMPVNKAGTVTVTVSAPAHPETEALVFTGSGCLPKVDLVKMKLKKDSKLSGM